MADVTPERIAELRQLAETTAPITWAHEAVTELLAEVERLREGNTKFAVVVQGAWAKAEAAEAEVAQLTSVLGVRSGAHELSVAAFIGMGEAVMTTIADGGTLAQVLDVVGDWMNGRDAIDDDSLALFERAKAVATR